MSRNGASLPAQGPVLGDVARLWVHIKTEWVTDLAIRLEPGQHLDGTPFLELRLESERFSDQRGGQYTHVWSRRRFSGVDYRGSYNQLYDLLIVGFREIERELKPQERETSS
jgi:hypothetical protein